MGVFGLDLSHIYISQLLLGRLLLLSHILAFVVLLLLIPHFYRRYIKGMLSRREGIFLAAAVTLFIAVSLLQTPYIDITFFDEQQYISGGLHMWDYLGFFDCIVGSAYHCTQLGVVPHGMAYSFFGSFLSIFAYGNISLFEHIIKSLNLLFSSLAIVAFYLLLKTLFGKRNISLLATFLFASCPIMLAYSTSALTEPSTLLFFLLSAWVAYLAVKTTNKERSRLCLLLITLLFFAFSNRGEMMLIVLPFLAILLISLKRSKYILLTLVAYLPLLLSHLLNYSGKKGLHYSSYFGGIYLTYWLSASILPLTIAAAAIAILLLIMLAGKKTRLLGIEVSGASQRFLLYLLLLMISTMMMFSTIPFKDEYRYLLPLSFVPYLFLGALNPDIKVGRLAKTALISVAILVTILMIFLQLSYAEDIKEKFLSDNYCSKKQMELIRKLDSLDDTTYSYSYPISYLTIAFTDKTEISEQAAREQGNISFYAISTVFDNLLSKKIYAKEKTLIVNDKECGLNITLVKR